MQQRQTAFIVIAVGALAISVSGCSSKQDLNEANLADALNAYYAPDPGICLRNITFPYPVSRDDLKNAETIGNNPTLTPIPGLEALKSAGLLTSSDAPSPASDGAAVRTYSLTAAGAAAFTDAPSKGDVIPAGSRTGAFCYGHVHVTRVVKWDPALMGESKAYFYYEMVGFPEWAKQPAVQRDFPTLGNLAQGAGTAGTSSVVMRLTSAGWEVKH